MIELISVDPALATRKSDGPLVLVNNSGVMLGLDRKRRNTSEIAFSDKSSTPRQRARREKMIAASNDTQRTQPGYTILIITAIPLLDNLTTNSSSNPRASWLLFFESLATLTSFTNCLYVELKFSLTPSYRTCVLLCTFLTR